MSIKNPDCDLLTIGIPNFILANILFLLALPVFLAYTHLPDTYKMAWASNDHQALTSSPHYVLGKCAPYLACLIFFSI